MLRLSYWKRWTRNSIHSATGISWNRKDFLSADWILFRRKGSDISVFRLSFFRSFWSFRNGSTDTVLPQANWRALSRLSKKTCAWHRTMLRFCYRRKRKVGTFCQVPKKRSSKRTSSCVVGSSWRFVCSSEGKRRHKPPSHRLRFPTDESYFLPFSRQENYITKSVVASNHVQTSIFIENLEIIHWPKLSPQLALFLWMMRITVLCVKWIAVFMKSHAHGILFRAREDYLSSKNILYFGFQD